MSEELITRIVEKYRRNGLDFDQALVVFGNAIAFVLGSRVVHVHWSRA